MKGKFMGPKYEHFKFELGQFVQQRINADLIERKMIVTERLVQECPGGVQLHYRCRPQREMSQQYLEIELEDYTPDVGMSAEELESRLLIRAELRRRREEAEKAKPE